MWFGVIREKELFLQQRPWKFSGSFYFLYSECRTVFGTESCPNHMFDAEEKE